MNTGGRFSGDSRYLRYRENSLFGRAKFSLSQHHGRGQSLVWPDVCATPVRGGLRGQRVGDLRVDDLLSVGVAVVEPVGSRQYEVRQ